MGTTIKVNNTVITVGNTKKAVASKESAIEIYDLEDLSAQAAEAYVLADTMYKTCESMHMFSSEGVGTNIANGVKKVLHAIADFFKKIAAYVTSFITGNAIMMKAKAIAKRAAAFKANNTPFPDKLLVKAKYTSAGHVEEIINVAKEITAKVNSDDVGILNNAKFEKLATDLTKAPVEVRLAQWFKSWDDVIAVCTNNQKGVVGAMVAMKAGKVSENAKKNATLAIKLAESAGQSDGEAHIEDDVKKLKAKQKMTNLAVKGYTTAINCALNVAAAACTAAKPAKEEKAAAPAKK